MRQFRRLETEFARKFRKRNKARYMEHVKGGWCPSTGPYTGVSCMYRKRHEGNHRAEDFLDPIIIEEWCEPRLSEPANNF